MVETTSYPAWVSYAAPLVALILLVRVFRRRKLNPPPGPKPWPVIGNLNLMGELPHRSLQALAKKYGPLMQLKFGSHPVVVGSSVEMAKAILKTHDLSLADRPRLIAGKYTTYNYKNIAWSQYGPYWRTARKMCVMELFSPKRLDELEYIRVEEKQKLLNALYKTKGQPVNVREHFASVSFSVISRLVFGRNYMEESDDVKHIVSPKDFKEMIDESFHLNGVLVLGDYIPWLGFLDFQGYVKRMKALGQKMDQFMEHTLAEHNARRKGVKNYVPKDMMDILLQVAEDPNLEVKFDNISVKAFIQDLINGGTESASVTTEWAIAELLRNPHYFEKATEELDRVIGRDRLVQEKDIENLPFIVAIIKETMRMHPVSPLLVPRLAREDLQIDGYDIPKGTRVIVNVAAIARHPDVWDKPNEFCPERFIGSTIDVKGHDFELLPFGAGRRVCPGYPLGIKVIQTSVANLLHGFKWKLPGNMKPGDLSVDEKFGLSVTLKSPLVAVVEPRLSPKLYSISI